MLTWLGGIKQEDFLVLSESGFVAFIVFSNVAQAVFELELLLPLECWGNRRGPACLLGYVAFSVVFILKINIIH